MKKMMKITAVAIAALLFCGVFALTGCSCNPLTDEPLSAKVIADFTKTAADREEFVISDKWENGEPFNAFWKKDNISFENNKASLAISEMTEKEQVWDEETKDFKDCISEYYGAEMTSKNYYGFGDYSVSMKPSKVTGTASTFFTYTGPGDKWFGDDGNVIKINPHDEIDIEFLGKDTTKVQFNYFANGVGGHEYMYDLGFDASEAFHDYGFRWTKNDITWFVDNKPVYKVERKDVKEGEPWPEEPGRVMMNYWSGTEKASAWMGKFTEDYNGRAEYQWAATSSATCTDPASTDPSKKPPVQEPIPEGIVWDDDTVFPFAETPVYSVATDEAAKTHTVTYTAAKTNEYTNINAAVQAPGRNYLGITLAGKTDKPIVARVNLMSDAADQLAKKAYVSNGTVFIEGGANVTVPANESVDVVVYYEGAISKVEVMIDSLYSTDAITSANTLEISHMKFGVKGEVIVPESKNNGIKIGDNLVRFAGSAAYTIETPADGSTMTVKYANLDGEKYDAINTADITSIIGSNNQLTFKVKNNGEKSVKLRVDVLCDAGAGTPVDPNDPNGAKNNFCNVGGEISGPGGVAHETMYQYTGGDSFTIAAGLEATCSVTFTPDLAHSLTIFIDSYTYQDTEKHTSELIFSEMALATVSLPDNPDVPDGPVVPDEGEGVNVLDTARFASVVWENDYVPYTVTQTASSLNAAYSELSGKSYATFSADVSSIVASNNALTFKVTNSGEAEAKIRVDIGCPDGQGTANQEGAGQNFCNTKAVVSGATASGNDYLYGGADWFKVAPGQTATVTVSFTTGVGADTIRLFADSSTYDDESTHTGLVVFTDMILFTIAA